MLPSASLISSHCSWSDPPLPPGPAAPPPPHPCTAPERVTPISQPLKLRPTLRHRQGGPQRRASPRNTRGKGLPGVDPNVTDEGSSHTGNPSEPPSLRRPPVPAQPWGAVSPHSFFGVGGHLSLQTHRRMHTPAPPRRAGRRLCRANSLGKSRQPGPRQTSGPPAVWGHFLALHWRVPHGLDSAPHPRPRAGGRTMQDTGHFNLGLPAQGP